MSWSRFKTYFHHNADLGMSVDISRMPFPDDFFSSMEPQIQDAFDAMTKLESGAIANPDEKRMVGHYWLRAPQLAPTPEITGEITSTLAAIKQFAARVHSGEISGPRGKFRNLLVIGIGGSALGPQ
ncbi:MAG: glucose-6-phosphate isomerase, partial [Opitutaceae bacterium]